MQTPGIRIQSGQEGGGIMREDLAKLAHDQWSGWMKYLFSKGTFSDDGTFTIPKELVDRWVRQMHASYHELSEQERDSDRKEADKFLEVFEQVFNDTVTLPRFLHDSLVRDRRKLRELTKSDSDYPEFKEKA